MYDSVIPTSIYPDAPQERVVQYDNVIRGVDQNALMPAVRYPSLIGALTGHKTMAMEVAQKQTVEKCRAELAASAIQYAGALCAEAEQVVAATPSSEPYVRGLVSAFATGAAIQIMRF